MNAQNAEIVILIGSENGKTRVFGKVLYEAISKHHQTVYLDDLNHFRLFPNMKELIVLTSTYGEGEAPFSGNQFLKILEQTELDRTILFSVLGFGSTKYPMFCQFAKDVFKSLSAKPYFKKLIDPVYIDKNNYTVFKEWVNHWSATKGLELNIPNELRITKDNIYDFTVTNKWIVNDLKGETFFLELFSDKSVKFIPGDLISITPDASEETRLYSVGKLQNGNLLLCIKKHADGVCSNYLFQKNKGDKIKGGHVINTHFHFPKKAKKVIMIANGTGIAPFIGMILTESNEAEKHLIWGVRTHEYAKPTIPILQTTKGKNTTLKIDIAYSREQGNFKYVQDIVNHKSKDILHSLEEGATLMICGSLAMRNSILNTLDELLQPHSDVDTGHYIKQGQILSDCY